MKRYLCIVIAGILLLSTYNVYAARPTSIKFHSKEFNPDKKKHFNYIVDCSNGKTQFLSAWNKRNTWCVGKSISTNCHNKQIIAAKHACNM